MGALTRIADESEEVAYDRVKREFENLEIEVSESITEYFARLHIILMELEGHKIVTPAREIKRAILGSLTSRFPNETRLYAMRGDFDLTDLEAGLVRAEKFQVRPRAEERLNPRAGRCPSWQLQNWGWRWSPRTRPARKALGQAPRQWS